MDLGAHLQCSPRGKAHELNPPFRRVDAFMDKDICAFGVFIHPFIGVGVAAVNKLQPVPFQRETDRAVNRMNSREGSDDRGRRFYPARHLRIF